VSEPQRVTVRRARAGEERPHSFSIVPTERRGGGGGGGGGGCGGGGARGCGGALAATVGGVGAAAAAAAGGAAAEMPRPPAVGSLTWWTSAPSVVSTSTPDLRCVERR